MQHDWRSNVDLSKLDEAIAGEQVTGEDFLAAIILVAIGFFLGWLIRRWSRRLLKRVGNHQSEPLIAFGARVAQVLVVAVFVGWALTTLGADIGWLTLMVAVSVFIAVLAARPIVEGLGAGAALSTRPAFSVGDEIAVDDAVGEVIDITSRSTVIRLRDGREVHIPNVEMLDKTVTVYTATEERRSSVEVIVDFGTDLDQAREVIRERLGEVAGISRLGSIRSKIVASGVELSIRFWHSPGIQAGNDARDAAIPAILGALADADIGIAPPADIAIVDHHQPSTP
jgi:small-conductance mechanosensitive channel